MMQSATHSSTGKKEFDFEHPLTNLVWITSGSPSLSPLLQATSSLATSTRSEYGDLWWALSVIISCGTIAGALIPEFTKVFTSTKSRHCEEVVNASRQGGRFAEHPFRSRCR